MIKTLLAEIEASDRELIASCWRVWSDKYWAEASFISARAGVEMPIANAVAGILFDQVSIKSTVSQLLSRHVRDETDTLYGKQAGMQS